MVPTNGSTVHHAFGIDAGAAGAIEFDAGSLSAVVDHVAFERDLLIAGAGGYDTFQSAVRSAVDARFSEQHANLLSTNAAQVQKLAEHESLKIAFDSAIKQRDDAMRLNVAMADQLEALLKLYPADAIKRDDEGGRALRAMRDFVQQIRAVKK
jgi:hypothetical protein